MHKNNNLLFLPMRKFIDITDLHEETVCQSARELIKEEKKAQLIDKIMMTFKKRPYILIS